MTEKKIEGEGERPVPDIMLWVTESAEREVSSLEAVGNELRGLDYVSGTDIRTEGSVVHVSFEGGRAEQEEIEGVIQEAGYEIFKASHRDT